MKILLVQPNPRCCNISFACSNIPLGPLYVAAALRKAGYGQVEFLDARMLRLNLKAVSKKIQDFSPGLVGLTGLSSEAAEIRKLAEAAKAAAPGCRVVVGGPCATSDPAGTLNDPHVDFVVVGEGERTACELAGALERGTPLEAVAGLGFKKDGRAVLNPPRPFIENPDEIPFPAWELADIERYFHLWNRHSQNAFIVSERVMPLVTSRGCPYGCTFCHNIFGKKTRFRSVENVLGEIEELVGKYGAKDIEILDDIFNLDLPRAKKICDEIVRRGIKINISFPNGLRADRMDEELVVKLKRAGAYLAVYAIETASPRIQKQIKKNLDLEKAARIVRFTAEQGITTAGFFMLGFPGETKEEMETTINYAVGHPFHFANFFYVTPRPNTELYETLAKDGARLGSAVGGDYFLYSVNLSAVPDTEFRRMREDAYDRFYFRRPLHLLRGIARIPNKLHTLKLLARAYIFRRWA